MDEKNILVLGAIEAFCDIVHDLEDMGYNAVCCDFYEHAAAKRISKYSYLVSTTDVEKILDIAQKHNVKGVIMAFSDRNLKPALEVCKSLGLPIYYTEEVIDILTDKINMKNHFKKNDFPVIPYKVLNASFDENDLEGLQYPLILKPIDGYGSKGIYKCHDISEIREHLKECLNSSQKYTDKLLIEEFYDADEFSVSGWVREGTFYLTSTYDVGRNFESSVVLSYVAFPSQYEKKYKNELKDIIQQMTESLGIVEGPVTVQFFVGAKGLKVGEYLYRLAGGSPYLYAVELGGPNIAKMLIDFQAGNEIDYQNLLSYRNDANEYRYYDILVFSSKEGRVHYEKTKEQLLKIPGIENVLLYHDDNEYLYEVSKKGKLVMRLFYRKHVTDTRSYTDIIDELRENIIIRDDQGENITILRYPKRDFENGNWAL